MQADVECLRQPHPPQLTRRKSPDVTLSTNHFPPSPEFTHQNARIRLIPPCIRPVPFPILNTMKANNGYSLIELTFVLMLSTLLLGLAAAPIGHARDVMSVRAARGDLASLLALTRATAVMTGGATLVVDIDAGSAWIEQAPGIRVGDVQHIAERHNVQLGAGSPLLSIRYDALGIGRMSNATLRVKRGSITGTLTISAYGRVRQS